MTLRRLSPKTMEAYLRAVKGLAEFHNLSPDKLDSDQILRYLQYLIVERKLAWSTVNQVFSGLCCFYRDCLGREDLGFSIPPRPRIRKLPNILSRNEVFRLIDAADNIKQHALLMTIYGAGLRVSEVVRLKAPHIESDPDRMLIRVEQGKGRKDRYTILSDKLLEELRLYWKCCRPEEWLFPGQKKSNFLTVSSAQKYYNRAKEKAGITRGKGIHTLRHCFATHLLEQGVDIYTIKKFLGHSSIVTTMRYLHITKERIALVKSPLDFDKHDLALLTQGGKNDNN